MDELYATFFQMLKSSIIFIGFLFISSTSVAQSWKSLILNVKTTSTPYSTEQNEEYYEKRKVLHGMDSIVLVEQLTSVRPIAVNPKGGTAFGQLDCEDKMNCLKTDELGEVAVYCFLKIGKNFLLHVELTATSPYSQPRGILINMNSKGKVINWLFSNGSVNGGNPHGNVTRDLTMKNDGVIKISEAAWGDNSKTYSMKAIYKLSSAKNRKGNLNIRLIKRTYR